MCFVAYGCLTCVADTASADPDDSIRLLRSETIDDPYLAGPGAPPTTFVQRAGAVVHGRFQSVQVNIDALGNNIPGDAANEPSIAIDPTNPDVIVIGWRQFDNVASNFRQAGYAYSHDRGQTWTYPGKLQPGQFRSDPVLDADSQGNIYYYSLSTIVSAEFFKSSDGGVTWAGPIPGHGGDKAWIAIDRTGGMGDGHVYATWNRTFSCCPGSFTRSTDGGLTFMQPISVPQNPFWGTMSVGPNGEVYVPGTPFNGFAFLTRSSNAQNAFATPVFEHSTFVDLGGLTVFATGPNPAGLLGQTGVATDHSNGPSRGNVYLLSTVSPFISFDPADIMFVRSSDNGVTWSAPVRINDDPTNFAAWQWFGTMSVAPNGRIDVIWNDTRNAGGDFRLSELFYSFSLDEGQTWSPNITLSPQFNSHDGFPGQNKLGDYYDMISDDSGASLAYSATFNGEQDVYFLRIGFDCDGNDVADEDEIAGDPSMDCNDNAVLDSCEITDQVVSDCNSNSVPDECELDSDGDTIIDVCDNCPLDGNLDQADTDGDGAGDVCDLCPNDPLDDRDGDGACDSDEQCPNDPNKLNPGECGCGVTDTDSDGDTVADCNDQCPNADDLVFAPECVGAIPTVSEWGLVVLALLLLVISKAFFSRRVRPI